MSGTFMGINHAELTGRSGGAGGGPINISLAADIKPAVKALERIADALEAIGLNCDSEGIIDAIARVQLRVDVPEMAPKIEIQPAAVNVSLPEMSPVINLTAPDGVAIPAPVVIPPSIVNFMMPRWFLIAMTLLPSVLIVTIYLLRSYL